MKINWSAIAKLFAAALAGGFSGAIVRNQLSLEAGDLTDELKLGASLTVGAIVTTGLAYAFLTMGAHRQLSGARRR